MTALDVLRDDLVSEAAKIPAAVTSAKEDAAAAATALNSALTVIEAIGKTLSSQAEQVRAAEILPTEFTGIIHGYRYGTVDEDDVAGGVPTHRMEVQVPGTGLWLHCSFDSAMMDKLLMTADPPIRVLRADIINGRTVTVRRDAIYGQVIPVAFGAPIDGPVLGKDFMDNEVREGDTVRLKENFSRAIKATLRSYDGNILTVKRSDRKTESQVNVKNLTTFEKIGGSLAAIRPMPLGTDKGNKELFVGDFVRLFDEFNDGRVAGVIVGQDATNEKMLVMRGDGKEGVGPKGEWVIAPESTIKVERVLIGQDEDGNVLTIGDRIRTVNSSEGDTGGYLVGLSDDGNNFYIARDDSKRNATGPLGTYAINQSKVRKAINPPVAA